MKLKKNEKALRENLLKVAKIALGDADFSFESVAGYEEGATHLKYYKEYDYDIDPEEGTLFAYWYDNDDRKWKVSPDGYGYSAFFDSDSEFWSGKNTDAMDSYIGEYEGGQTWIFNDDAYDRKERIADYEKIDYTESEKQRGEYLEQLYDL